LQQPERAAATTAAACERLRGPSRFPSFSSQESDRFIEQLRRKRPYPTPILTRCKQPGDAVLSLGKGVPEDAGWKDKKATFSGITQANGDKLHSRPPLNTTGALDSIPREAGGSKPGSTWLSGNLRYHSTDLSPRRAASLQQLRVGQGACGRRFARSISGRCKISRNLRKRLECGAAIGPPGRGLGRAGEGRSEEVDGKYEGVVWQRGVVIQFPSLPAQLFFRPPPRKAHHQLLFPGGRQPLPRTALRCERPSPGISHWRWSGPTQCRRWCPWQNSLDQSALDAVTQAILLLHLAPPRHPASPPEASLLSPP
jgi:hypothetical protein